jgi:hypothetical protein
MAYTVVIHVANDDPIVADLDELPGPSDIMLTIHNPRRRDGKDVHFLSNDVVTVIWTISQISFIEVIPSEGEEKIIGFVRE